MLLFILIVNMTREDGMRVTEMREGVARIAGGCFLGFWGTTVSEQHTLLHLLRDGTRATEVRREIAGLLEVVF